MKIKDDYLYGHNELSFLNFSPEVSRESELHVLDLNLAKCLRSRTRKMGYSRRLPKKDPTTLPPYVFFRCTSILVKFFFILLASPKGGEWLEDEYIGLRREVEVRPIFTFLPRHFSSVRIEFAGRLENVTGRHNDIC